MYHFLSISASAKLKVLLLRQSPLSQASVSLSIPNSNDVMVFMFSHKIPLIPSTIGDIGFA